MQDKKNSLFLTILLASIFGIGAGVAGGLAARNFISDKFLNIPLYGEIDLSAENQMPNFIIRDPKKVVVNQDERAREVINSAKTNSVGIFKKKSFKDKGLIKENYYAYGQEEGEGTIITSDGWIIANFKADPKEKYVVVTNAKMVYEIDNTITDKLTSMVFLHVGAKDFPVKKFAEQEVSNGMSVIVVKWTGEAKITSILEAKNRNSADLLESSDAFSRKIKLADSLEDDFSGATVYNFEGSMLGLFEKGNKVEPITHFDSAIKSLLKNKEIYRPSLGVNYIDLSRLAGSSAAPSGAFSLRQELPDKGALITKDDKGISVIKGSPAFQAGLKEGDIIVSINGLGIDKENNLSEVLQKFQSKEKVTATILRGGDKKVIEVVFN